MTTLIFLTVSLGFTSAHLHIAIIGVSLGNQGPCCCCNDLTTFYVITWVMLVISCIGTMFSALLLEDEGPDAVPIIGLAVNGFFVVLQACILVTTRRLLHLLRHPEIVFDADERKQHRAEPIKLDSFGKPIKMSEV
eukprot:TRINITY_DN131_c0_g1_i1.p1 TRINITY_DN131_c0_g1~~TRINITY_DN131_c0_g1_i1.p1  ORF type:complete len:136 (+),score=23.57 TRINITY_DN131_c0_g1_i1:76-483(+)